MSPHVAILLPVYNAAPWLAAALQSLVGQTYPHLSILILDDGSTDSSPQILADFARRYAHIRLLHQPNAGGVATLNRLIDHALSVPDATGAPGAPGAPPADYLTLMHADDIALPTRIEKQVACLTANPSIDIAGTWIESFVDQTDSQSPIPNSQFPTPHPWHYPFDPRFTAPSLLFWCCFAHPTMMFRRHVLEGSASTPPLRYDPAFPMPCEDYALWARASQTFQMGNVPEVLLRYRLHAAQASAARRQAIAALTRQIRQRLLESLGIVATVADMDLHQRLADSDLLATPDFVHASRTWLERLQAANVRTSVYDAQAFPKILAGRWAATCIHAATHLPQTAATIWHEFWSSPLARHVDRTLEKNRPIPPSA